MPEEISSFFLSAGIQLSFYCLGRLVNNLALYLEDKDEDSILCRMASFLSVCLYIAGFFVSIAIGLLNQYPTNRVRKAAYQEGMDSMKPLMESEIRISVQKENERMRNVMESALDHQHIRLSNFYEKKLQEELDLERNRLLWDILRKNPPSSVSESSDPPQHRTYAHADDGTLIEL